MRFGRDTIGLIIGIWLVAGFAVISAMSLGPAWAAAHGRGVLGTFTVTSHPCTTSRGHTSCEWHGTFTSTDGTDFRTDVEMTGGLGDRAAVGRSFPALDAGDSNHVFVPRGSHAWIGYLAALLGTAALLGGALWWICRGLLATSQARLSRLGPAGPAQVAREFSATLITAGLTLAVLIALNILLADHAAVAGYVFANLGAALTGLVAVSIAVGPITPPPLPRRPRRKRPAARR